VRALTILALAPLAYLVFEGCVTVNENVSAGIFADGGIPKTAACTSDPTLCLSGTVALDSRFTAKPVYVQIALHQLFPAGDIPVASLQPVAMDRTWAFSALLDAGPGLPSWSHYYVRAAASFNFDADAGSHVPTAIVGPLTVPSSGKVSVTIVPVQVELLESRGSGGTLSVDSVLAHVFDPATGNEVQNQNGVVSVTVGGANAPLAWTTLPGDAGSAYTATFASPPAAQATYTVTMTYPPGSAPVTYQLVADPPAFDGTVDATVPDAGVVAVSWTPEPQADYELVELFRALDGGYGSTPTYASPSPQSPDETAVTIGGGDAGVPAGNYLVNVAYAKANCPSDAGGCVLAQSVAAQQINVP
jgi:hypothetical protein